MKLPTLNIQITNNIWIILQKLSLNKQITYQMIGNDTTLYIIHALRNYKETPNDILVYISALLVNLVVKKSGRETLESDAANTLEVLHEISRDTNDN